MLLEIVGLDQTIIHQGMKTVELDEVLGMQAVIGTEVVLGMKMVVGMQVLVGQEEEMTEAAEDGLVEF